MNKVIVYSILLLTLSGCTLPKFTQNGGISTERSINVAQYKNTSGLGSADIHIVFTEKTKDYFQQNTKLELVDAAADIDLNCVITNYEITPVAAQKGETAALNRLTLTVKIDYINYLFPDDSEKNVKARNFTFFKNYSRDADFTTIEADLIDEIADQIIINIFNATAGSW